MDLLTKEPFSDACELSSDEAQFLISSDHSFRTPTLTQSPPELLLSGNIDPSAETRDALYALELLIKWGFDVRLLARPLENGLALVGKPDAVCLNGTDVRGTLQRQRDFQTAAIGANVPATRWQNALLLEVKKALPPSFEDAGRFILNHRTKAPIGVLFALNAERTLAGVIPTVRPFEGHLAIDQNGHAVYKRIKDRDLGPIDP